MHPETWKEFGLFSLDPSKVCEDITMHCLQAYKTSSERKGTKGTIISTGDNTQNKTT